MPSVIATCLTCRGSGRINLDNQIYPANCTTCGAAGSFFDDPSEPAPDIRPGSPEKIALLAARYQSCLPLFLEGDMTVLPEGCHV